MTHNRTAFYYTQLGHCYEAMQQLFADAGQSAHFPTIIDHILEFHLRGMLASSCMDEDSIAGALPAWEWLFRFEQQNNLIATSPLAFYDHTPCLTERLDVLRKADAHLCAVGSRAGNSPRKDAAGICRSRKVEAACRRIAAYD